MLTSRSTQYSCLALFVVAATMLLALASTLRGQSLEDSQTGRTFIIAFPDTVGNLTDPRHPSLLRDTFAQSGSLRSSHLIIRTRWNTS